MTSITWQRSPAQLADAIDAYGRRVELAVAAVGAFIAPKIEAYAKENASWTDRTGQARSGLTAINKTSTNLITIYLDHQTKHGKWLEIAHGAPYRIILPTLVAHYGEVMDLLRRVLGEAA